MTIHGYKFRTCHAFKDESACITKDPTAPFTLHPTRGLILDAELLELGFRLETGSATDMSWPGQISSSRKYLLQHLMYYERKTKIALNLASFRILFVVALSG